MSDAAAEVGAELSGQAYGWTDLWKQLDPDDRQELLVIFIDTMRRDPKRKKWWREISEYAAHLLRWMPKNLEKKDSAAAAKAIQPLVARILADNAWREMFAIYRVVLHGEIGVDLFTALGIECTANGVPTGVFTAPSARKVKKAVDQAVAAYGAPVMATFCRCLLLDDPEKFGWLAPEMDVLERLSDVEALKRLRGSGAGNQPAELVPTLDPMGDEFTTLDRVLIQQIVNTVQGGVGALDEGALEDLVMTVIRLGPLHHRSFFHLGYMDAMVPGRAISLERPEYNVPRRSWYLAGVLAALARADRFTELEALVRSQGAAFRAAAAALGGAGQSIAQTSLAAICSCKLISEARALLEGQYPAMSGDIAWKAFVQAERFVLENDETSAEPILELLLRLVDDPDAPTPDSIDDHHVRRRYAQCLQARGDFERAKAQLKLLIHESKDVAASVYADLALVEGGFRRLWDVTIPEAPSQREIFIDSLEQGRKYLDTAVEQFRDEAMNAKFLLGVLAYLRFSVAKKSDEQNSAQEEALANLLAAVPAMRSSPLSEFYEKLGIIETALFCIAVCRMHRMEPAEAQASIGSWKQIATHRHRFPQHDLELFISAAEAVDPDLAASIMESVWKVRGREALPLLLTRSLAAKSAVLRDALWALAQDAQLAREQRWRVMEDLCKARIAAGENEAAEDVLDAMENLAMTEGFADRWVSFLSAATNYDPVWSKYDTLWSMVRALRNEGRDADAIELLRKIFYLVRDYEDKWALMELAEFLEAHDIELDRFEDPELSRALSDSPADAPTDVARLAAGERVRVVFVGGNEVQKRYDESVVEQLAKRYPGVEIEFFHTGWSSNWGRELQELTRIANESDVVVTMIYMRTMLGRRLRAALVKPWVSCGARGRDGILRSIERAAVLAISRRLSSVRVPH